MEEILRFVCEGLEQRHISYMLSGSVAMGAYAVARYTRDIDLVVELTEQELDRFAEMFSDPAAFYFHRPSVTVEVQRQGMFNVISQTSGFKVDFILKKNTPFQTSAFGRRQRGAIWGINCWLISAEDLILAKLIWIQDIFSENQANDIRNLLLDNPDADTGYLKYWIHALALHTYQLY